MRWGQIRKEAVSLAESKALEYCSSSGCKTELRRFASDLGVDRVELQDIDGDALIVERANGQFTLFLNRGHHKLRHRFSVAHELAHLLLTPSIGRRSVHRRRFTPEQDPEGRRIESLCNAMASAILMPRERVNPIVERAGYSAASVPMIAHAFQASFEAAARRYVGITRDPCAAVFWRPIKLGRVENLQKPVANEALASCWLEFKPSAPGERIFAERAMETDEMVVSKESVLLWRGRGNNIRSSFFTDTKVESFRRSRGTFRHIVSFVYVPLRNGIQAAARSRGQG